MYSEQIFVPVDGLGISLQEGKQYTAVCVSIYPKSLHCLNSGFIIFPEFLLNQFFSTFQLISARKQAEKVLNKSKENLCKTLFKL